MEDSDTNLDLRLPSPTPASPENNDNLIEPQPRSLFSSSLNPSSSGNDERESQNPQNWLQLGANSENQSKDSSPKNIISTTISTSSASFPLKRRILSEWTDTSPHTHLQKPSNLGSSQADTSNSTPTKSDVEDEIPFPGFPTFPSTYDDDVNVEDETFTPDPSTEPYDPVKNFLSPRPKFLRYDPNRHRQIFLPRQPEQAGSLASSGSRSSRDNSVYSTAESSMVAEMSGNVYTERHPVQEQVEDEEEEMMQIGARKCGMKSMLCKSLIVLAILVLSTVYISSMNEPELEPEPGMRSLMFQYNGFGNNTFRGVSFTSIEFRSWIGDVREESEMGIISEIDESFVVDQGRSKAKIYEMDDTHDQDGEELVEKIESLEGFYQNVSQLVIKDNERRILEGFEGEHEQVLNDEADMVGSDDIEVTKQEILVGYESNSEDGQSINEAVFAIESPRLEGKEKVVGDDEYEVKEFEPKCDEERSQHEEDTVCKDPVIGVDDESLFDQEDKLMVGSVPNSGNKSEILAENHMEAAVEEKISESVQKQFRLNPRNAVWLVITSVMTWVAASVLRFYSKCKKTSSKTISCINKKLRIQAAKNQNYSRLPPKPVHKTCHIQKTDPQLNHQPNPSSGMIIPRVEMLGEFVVGGKFTTISKIRVPENDLYYTKSSDADSSSFASYASREKTYTRQVEKEEVSKMTPTPLRRSSRLRCKGLTSP